MLQRLLTTLALIAGHAVGLAAADTIRLSQSAGIVSDAEGLTAVVELANNGTESARRLRWQAEFAGHPQSWPQPRETLAAGGTLTVSNRLRTAVALDPGEYPLVLTTDYRDEAGYPFAAVLATSVSNRMPARTAPLPLRIRLHAPGALGDQGMLRLVAASSHDGPLRLDARLVLPGHLGSAVPEQTFRLPAGGSRGISFPIQNLSARPGSRLPATVIISTEIDGLPRCAVASAVIVIPSQRGFLARRAPLWVVLAIVLLLLSAAGQWIVPGGRRLAACLPGINFFLWPAILILLAAHIPPALLLRDTLTVGGDTPAHNYLASHLGNLWMSQGRLLTWSHAWWCGFPAFQYYFTLPYALIAALSAVIPFNIAFKIVSVLGIALLPGSVLLSARLLRLPKTTAGLMTVMVLPFLFTDAHVMWGANLYSTLAGMIANSFSFALFPLCLASAWRDADDGCFRPRTALLTAVLMLSHFFTSIIAVLTIAVMPLLRPRAGMRQAFKALAAGGALACMLAAWWLVPLFSKQAYSVDFGSDWDVSLFTTLPLATIPALIPALAAVISAFRHRDGAIGLWVFMSVAAAVLFMLGTDLHPVFINVRLWPFVYFGILMLAAIGAGQWLERLRYPAPAVAAALLLVAVIIDNRPSKVRAWAEWNLEGLEAKPLAAEFLQLIEPLDGTPGRLAYDLNSANSVFGSSRIFEVVPHLIDKPILEGGLVNSALGALFAYTVQGEISARGAGYPTIVRPAEFNPALGMRHLELFNVRHLITAWQPLKKALTNSPAWRAAYRVDDWSVLEAVGPDEGFVGVLDAMPEAVVIADRQRAAVDWMQSPALLDRPFLWIKPGRKPPPGSLSLSAREYGDLLEQAELAPPSIRPFGFDGRPVAIEAWSEHRISFRTTAIGRPHMIKVSHFPNWRVSGAEAIYMVSPAFMLVVPDRATVDMVYGHTAADRGGHLVTLIGTALLAVWLAGRAIARFRAALPGR